MLVVVVISAFAVICVVVTTFQPLVDDLRHSIMPRNDKRRLLPRRHVKTAR